MSQVFRLIYCTSLYSIRCRKFLRMNCEGIAVINTDVTARLCRETPQRQRQFAVHTCMLNVSGMYEGACLKASHNPIISCRRFGFRRFSLSPLWPCLLSPFRHVAVLTVNLYEQATDWSWSRSWCPISELFCTATARCHIAAAGGNIVSAPRYADGKLLLLHGAAPQTDSCWPSCSAASDVLRLETRTTSLDGRDRRLDSRVRVSIGGPFRGAGHDGALFVWWRTLPFPQEFIQDPTICVDCRRTFTYDAFIRWMPVHSAL